MKLEICEKYDYAYFVPSKTEFLLNNIQKGPQNSREIHSISATNISLLMLFMEIYFYCEIYMKYTNAFCGQKAEFYYVKVSGTSSNHWAVRNYGTMRHLSPETEENDGK